MYLHSHSPDGPSPSLTLPFSFSPSLFIALSLSVYLSLCLYLSLSLSSVMFNVSGSTLEYTFQNGLFRHHDLCQWRIRRWYTTPFSNRDVLFFIGNFTQKNFMRPSKIRRILPNFANYNHFLSQFEEWLRQRVSIFDEWSFIWDINFPEIWYSSLKTYLRTCCDTRCMTGRRINRDHPVCACDMIYRDWPCKKYIYERTAAGWCWRWANLPCDVASHSPPPLPLCHPFFYPISLSLSLSLFLSFSLPILLFLWSAIILGNYCVALSFFFIFQNAFILSNS